MTQAELENKDFIPLVAAIVKMETKKDINARSERDKLHKKLVQVVYNTGARSTLSSDRPLTVISDGSTNIKAYSKLSEEEAPDLLPWNDVKPGNKLKRYKLKP